jgi:hypothetical protein
MIKIYLIIICMIIFISGCGKFDIAHHPAPNIDKASKIYVIDNPQTREGFKLAIQSWLSKAGIPFQVMPAHSDISKCEWSLRYYGKWSWDLALFLSEAQITAYYFGNQVGYEKLIVGQWDAYKFEKGTTRIHKMMDMLFSKVGYYVLPKEAN